MNNKITPKILWESSSLAKNGKPFITVKQARDYYLYVERAGIDSIAFILYDHELEIIGLIKEQKPPLDFLEGEYAMRATAFGGSLDDDLLSPEQICKQEVLEESGYSVEDKDIRFIGKTMVSTQMNQFLNGFIIDITDKIPGLTETQLAKPTSYKGNEVVWFDYEGLLENDDWKSIWIITKFLNGY